MRQHMGGHMGGRHMGNLAMAAAGGSGDHSKPGRSRGKADPEGTSGGDHDNIPLGQRCAYCVKALLCVRLCMMRNQARAHYGAILASEVKTTHIFTLLSHHTSSHFLL